MTPQEELEMLRLRAKAQTARASQSSETAAPAVKSEDPGLSEVATGVMQNFFPSAGGVLKDTVAPFAHPIDTIKNIGTLGAGAVEKMIPGEQPQEKAADAVGAHFKDRYGSWAGFKRNLRDDPAGVMADVSVPLTAGGSLAARAPGVIGKAGRIAKFAGGIEPVNLSVQSVKGVAKYAPHAIGAHTGVGQTPLHVAYEAGKSGNSDLLETAMRGDGSAPAMLDVVEDARKGMTKAYQARSSQYKQDMSPIAAASQAKVSQNVFQSIGRAAGKALNMHRFNGVDFSPKTLPVRKELYNTVVKWGNYDPQTFHTPEGLDKMKREIGDIRDGHELGTPEYKAANEVYKAIDAEIDKAFPDYATAMSNYAKNSKKLDNMSRTLSLGGKATDDTALRKLQSSMRHDVNTNYGGRLALIDELEKYAPGIKQRLAGQSLNSVIPRGLSKHFSVGQLGAAATLALHNPVLGIPLGISTITSSPRLMGEAALAAGKGVGAVGKVTPQFIKEIAPHFLRRPMLQGSRGIGMLSDEAQQDY